MIIRNVEIWRYIWTIETLTMEFWRYIRKLETLTVEFWRYIRKLETLTVECCHYIWTIETLTVEIWRCIWTITTLTVEFGKEHWTTGYVSLFHFRINSLNVIVGTNKTKTVLFKSWNVPDVGGLIKIDSCWISSTLFWLYVWPLESLTIHSAFF